MRKYARALAAKLREIDGMESAFVGVQSGEESGVISAFESKFQIIIPREVKDILETELAIRHFDLRFVKRLESKLLCESSKNSWADLRAQMTKSKEDYFEAGKGSIVPYWEKGAILLEDLWAGFATILEVIDIESYVISLVIPNGKKFKINLALPQYVDYLLQTKGLFLWQLMFIDEGVEGLRLGYGFFEALSIISEGESILQIPQFKRLDPSESFAEMAVICSFYDNIEKYLKPPFSNDFEYSNIEIQYSDGWNFLARVEHDLGRQLPRQLRAWFYLYNEVHIQWRNNRNHVAASKILSLNEVFGGNPANYEMDVPPFPLNKDAAHYYNDPSATDLLSGLYPFMIDERGDVVIGFEGDHTVLYLLDSDITTKTRLQVTLPEFIEWLCKTRGISGWHTYLVDPSEENLAELRAMVEEVFPGTEW